MTELPPILDVCCGSKMFWFDKDNPLAVFCDNRQENFELCDGRTLNISPDIIADFKSLPFPDKSFRLVVFDPPHLSDAGKNSWLAKKYGVLPKDWQPELRAGFDECWRVLDDFGVPIFKWSQNQIKIREVITALGREPLFGNRMMTSGGSHWFCYMKERS